jgi:hypothetical protein
MYGGGVTYRPLGGNLRARDQENDLGIDHNIILEWILRKPFGAVWTGLIWLRIMDKWRDL